MKHKRKKVVQVSVPGDPMAEKVAQISVLLWGALALMGSYKLFSVFYFAGGNRYGLLPAMIALAGASAAITLLARHYRWHAMAAAVAIIGASPLLVWSAIYISHGIVELFSVTFLIAGLAKLYWAYYSGGKLASDTQGRLMIYAELLGFLIAGCWAYYQLIGMVLGIVEP